MKKSIFRFAIAMAVGLACLEFGVVRSSAALKAGDAAPKLQVGKWIQGEPLKGFETGQVYVVEFWATWCGPCRATIPHLNELHKKLGEKGITFIGQNVWEEEETGVAPFVKKMGDKMTYRVALDDKSSDEKGAMATTWMKAAEQNGIPTAFVVDKRGIVAWIGHPMELTEELLGEVLAGKFDIAKASAAKEEASKHQEALNKLGETLNEAFQAKDWDKADSTLTEMKKVAPEITERLRVVSFQLLLLGRKDYPAAWKLAGEISDAHPDDVMMQNQIAWSIVTTKDIEKPNFELAEKLANRANKAAGGTDPGVLDTLARVQFLEGKTTDAVATQQKAVDLAEGAGKEQLQKTLDSYKAGKVPDVK